MWHDGRVPAGERDDAELVRRILKGEGEHFETLVARYQTRLFRFISRYTNDAEDARDVTQEVFLKIYGALDSFDPRYRFSTWLFRIAGNAAIDHLRRRRGRVISLDLPPDEEGDSRAIDPRDHGPDPLEDLTRRRLRQAIDDGDREAPRGLPRAAQSPALRRASLRGDRRAEALTSRNGQEQALPRATGPARSFASGHRIEETMTTEPGKPPVEEPLAAADLDRDRKLELLLDELVASSPALSRRFRGPGGRGTSFRTVGGSERTGLENAPSLRRGVSSRRAWPCFWRLWGNSPLERR